MLHYFDGLNVNDLAIKLKISHEAARKRLHRALTRLRAHLTYAGTAPTAAALPGHDCGTRPPRRIDQCIGRRIERRRGRHG